MSITIMQADSSRAERIWDRASYLQRQVTRLEMNVKWLQKCLTEEKLSKRPCLEHVSNIQGYIESDLVELHNLSKLTCSHCGKTFLNIDKTILNASFT